MANRKGASEKEGGIKAFDRITFEPGKMGGRACIRGMRITVGLAVSLVAEGLSWDEILTDYPYLESADITFRCSFEDWVDIAAGREEPQKAVLKRKLRLRGNPRVLWRTRNLFR